MSNSEAVLSLDQARDSLKATLSGLRSNASALAEARATAAGDTFKRLEIVGPVMAQVQFPVIKPLGYTEDDDGLMNYTSAVRQHETNDDIAALTAQIHTIVLLGEADGKEGVPKLALQPTEVTYDEILLSARGAKPAS